MTALALIFFLVSLVAIISHTWLVIVAFQRRLLWGFLVLLFSPVTALIFGIKYWPSNKKPFLSYMISTTACFMFLGYMFVQLGVFEMLGMAQRIQKGEISEQETVHFFERTMERMKSSGLLTEKDKEELTKMQGMFEGIIKDSREGFPESAPAPLVLETLSVQKAPAFLGYKMRIEGKDGMKLEAALIRVEKNMFIFQKQVEGGVMELAVPTREIASLQVFR